MADFTNGFWNIWIIVLTVLGIVGCTLLVWQQSNWKGKKGPFDELWKVKQGQEVKLTDAAGGAWVYRVDATETIHKSELAGRSEQLFSPDGPHKLLLVTCGGEYVGGSEGYEDNRVVTASLVSRP